MEAAETDREEAGLPASGDELSELVAHAQTRRLSATEEERAGALLKERLLGGKAGVAETADVLPKLAWMVGISAVAAAWPDMKATAKTQLLKALADQETEAARRIRLSLARALFKLQDMATSLKIAVAVAKEMRGKDSGEVSPRDAQIFSNVFLGKAKPWCAQLPLGDLRPGDADALVHCAITAAFSTPHPPLTQLGVLKWAAENGRLARLSEGTSSTISNSLRRWSGKWRVALRNEVADLPEEILAALPPAEERAEQEQPNAASPERVQGPTGISERDDDAPPAESSEVADDGEQVEGDTTTRERPVYVSKTIPQRDNRDNRDPRDPRENRAAQPAPQRGIPPRGAQFNISDALRQIEAHVAWLRSELKNAESKARPREDDRRGRRRPETVVIEGEPSIEELARLNVQLEARIATLQAQIRDLTTDSEDRAASRGALVDAPAPSPDDQLRSLLALKLQDDYADFLALEQESRDLVVQQHYRSLLREVFDVLKNEGVALQVPAETSMAR